MASALRPRRPINVALASESRQIACGGRHKDWQREKVGDRWGIGRSERDDWEVSLTSKREGKQKKQQPCAAALSLLPRRPSRSSCRQVALDLTGRRVVRGGRGSGREGSTKERGGGAAAVLENGKEEIGGAGDERGEGRRCRVQSGDETGERRRRLRRLGCVVGLSPGLAHFLCTSSTVHSSALSLCISF
jgi:hypothetical protein